MVAIEIDPRSKEIGEHNPLFETIAQDILHMGYSINHDALPHLLAASLWRHTLEMPQNNFMRAGVGRKNHYIHNQFVRSDEICWITGESDTDKEWLNWTSALQQYLNRRLLLGLFSFESHYAHYAPGDYYKRHYDAFKGEANRILSLVIYLNPGWNPHDGGELVIYKNEKDLTGLRVTPNSGTVVAFLSEDFPHEVLPSKRGRYSIAGWFRLNTSTTAQVDPPF